MTLKLKIENQDTRHALHVEPFDLAGDPPVPVSAGVIAVLPGQTATLYVHDGRSLQVYEGDAVKPDAAAALVDEAAPGEGGAADAAGAPGEAA